jgi:hypothetical protein
VAASAVLLGGGAAIGVALTGGASASTSSAPTASSTARASTSAAARRCAKLTGKVRGSGHPKAAARLKAFCDRPLLRLALVGGEHGSVTFRGKTGTRTVSVERGTVTSDTGSQLTVAAPDGTTWTWDLTASTAVRQDGKKVAGSTLSTGDLVFIGGPVVSGSRDARLIRIRKAS